MSRDARLILSYILIFSRITHHVSRWVAKNSEVLPGKEPQILPPNEYANSKMRGDSAKLYYYILELSDKRPSTEDGT